MIKCPKPEQKMANEHLQKHAFSLSPGPNKFGALGIRFSVRLLVFGTGHREGHCSTVTVFSSTNFVSEVPNTSLKFYSFKWILIQCVIWDVKRNFYLSGSSQRHPQIRETDPCHAARAPSCYQWQVVPARWHAGPAHQHGKLGSDGEKGRLGVLDF